MGASPLRTAVLARDLKIAVWQWPEHRVLFGKLLPKGWKAEVVAEEADGAMICCLGRNHHFVVWPENVLRMELTEIALPA
jgi:hypothetical protein